MTHAHSFDKAASFHRAPTGPYPEHTSFFVMTCGCGLMEIFPRDNFALCPPPFRAGVLELFRAAGYAVRLSADGGPATQGTDHG